MKQDANLGVIREILVCHGDVRLKVFEEQAIDGQHWCGLTLSSINGILNNRCSSVRMQSWAELESVNATQPMVRKIL